MVLKIRRTYSCLILLFFLWQNISSQTRDFEALVNSVISKKEYKQQEKRHLDINDSLARIDRLNLQEKYLDALIKTAQEKGLKKLQGITENSKGNFYLGIGNNYKAIEIFRHALSLYAQDNDYSGMSTLNANLGNAFYYVGDLEKALEYNRESADNYKKMPEKKGKEEKLANLYNNIGIIYCTKNDYKFGRIYFDLALEIWKNAGDSLSIAYAYNNYASIFSEQNKLDSAIYYFKIAFELKKRHGSNSDIIDANNNLCSYFIKVKQPKEALKYVLTSMNMVDTSIFNKELQSTYYYLSETYAALGDIKNQHKYFVKQIRVKDTLDARNQLSSIAKMEQKNEFDKVRLADSLKNQEEMKLKDIKITEKKQQSYFLIFALILTIIILFLIFQRFKSTQKQKKLIEEQKLIVEEKNKEITDSINYAKRLQDAILPEKNQYAAKFPESFVIYQPKDIVSGDFHFLEQKENIIFIAAADCTGHGVPGAMLTMACFNGLQKAIFEQNVTTTGAILDAVKNIITAHFNRTENNISDGMDISLLKIDISSKTIEWSGANNRLFYVYEDTLMEIKPDRQAVGRTETEKNYTTNYITFKTGTTFYLFTDGIVDQFGGENIKKYTIAKFRLLLEEIKAQGLASQEKKISEIIHNWKGKNEQTDDITVIGIKI